MFPGIPRPFRMLGLLLLLAAAPLPLRAGDGDVTLQARLVWGTDQKQSSSKEHKPIEGKTADELKKVFKWENYFVISTQNFSLKKGRPQTVKMSEKCSLEINSVGQDKFEVLLVGKGARVAKGIQKMPPGEKLFLMGLDKNESSWLIILEHKQD
jgi:hypothetical protein